MRGFVVVSLALVVLSVAVSAGQPTSARTDQLVAGLGLTNTLFRRLLDPTVAGIPAKKG